MSLRCRRVYVGVTNKPPFGKKIELSCIVDRLPSAAHRPTDGAIMTPGVQASLHHKYRPVVRAPTGNNNEKTRKTRLQPPAHTDARLMLGNTALSCVCVCVCVCVCIFDLLKDHRIRNPCPPLSACVSVSCVWRKHVPSTVTCI